MSLWYYTVAYNSEKILKKIISRNWIVVMSVSRAANNDAKNKSTNA